MSINAIGSDDWGPPSPGSRPCCMLSPTLARISQILDPTTLGRHAFGTRGTVGVIYTCRGGFIDLGHLRDLIDLTYYYLVYLTKRGVRKAGGVLRPFEKLSTRRLATIVVVKDIPDADLIDVARSMAFDESIMHEIQSYWRSDLGQHHSAFSPEDLVSNFLGAYVAGQALMREDAAFDRATTEELNNVLTLLDARTPAQTNAAFVFIEADDWVRSPNVLFLQSYLRRRNFNFKKISPCFIPEGTVGVGCLGPPSFPLPTEFPVHIAQYYTAKYDVNPTLLDQIHTATLDKKNFDSAIAQIMADANTRYGANFQCGQ